MYIDVRSKEKIIESLKIVYFYNNIENDLEENIIMILPNEIQIEEKNNIDKNIYQMICKKNIT